MPGDARKKGPDDAVGGGTPGGDNGYPNASGLHQQKQSPDFDWSPELQRALDILAAPIYHGLQIQIMGQAGCGHHPPTSDPAELERFAREVGLDASYSIVTGNGRVSWPILIDLSPSNGAGNPRKRASQGRPACLVPVIERNS